MSFGKRATPADDLGLAKALSDASAVGVSRHDIRKITEMLPEGLRTVDHIKDAIAKIEALKARFIVNDLDDDNLLDQSMGDASLVPDQPALTNTEPKSALHQAALLYVARGWPIFPCLPNSKVSLLGSNGYGDATTDPRQINAYWSENPNYNIALSPEAIGQCVIEAEI
jgi:hypothetical protein